MKIVNLETGTMEYPWERKVPLNTRLLPWWKRVIVFLRFSRKSIIDEDYYLYLPFEFMVEGRPYSRVYIKLPKETIVDGASIPKILRSFVSPEGVLYIGAIFHDRCYKEGNVILALDYTAIDEGMHDFKEIPISKHESDKLFCLINWYVTGISILPYLAYIGVSVGGWWTWWNYRKKEQLIIQTPTKPITEKVCCACGNIETDGHTYIYTEDGTEENLCEICARTYQLNGYERIN
jgi:hypothetical protein